MSIGRTRSDRPAQSAKGSFLLATLPRHPRLRTLLRQVKWNNAGALLSSSRGIEAIMKAIAYRQYGGPEVLELVDLDRARRRDVPTRECAEAQKALAQGRLFGKIILEIR